jgi:iron complex transport system ATP-binding protein
MTLVAADLEVRYQTRTAVRATSVTLAPGELVALVGPNGAGKSSLLKALAGLTAHDGVVTWQGTALATLSPRARARAVAYLPQDPPVHWPFLARDLVTLGRLPHRGYGVAPSAADRAVVLSAMQETDTLEFATRSVDRLSVGERARVLLARALAVQAPVLLVDEPIAMLDPYHQLHVMSTLAAYAGGGSGGRVVVAVLHDLGLAARFCGRVLMMRDGAVVADGPPDAALGDASIRAHYRVEPLIGTHDGEPLIVPWRPLRDEPASQR